MCAASSRHPEADRSVGDHAASPVALFLGSGGLGCFELLAYGAADAPAGRDVDAVRLRPGPDRCVVRAHLGGLPCATAPPGTTANPTAVVSVELHVVMELLPVLRRQVELVVDPVVREADRLGALATVDVVGEDDLHLLYHLATSLPSNRSWQQNRELQQVSHSEHAR